METIKINPTTILKGVNKMKNKEIQRMVDLYDKLIDDIWNQTDFMTDEEADEYHKLIEKYRVAGYPEMEEEK